MNEILEARSQSATRKVRDTLVKAGGSDLRAASTMNRVFSNITPQAFIDLIKANYPEAEVKTIAAKEPGSMSSQFPTFVFKVDDSDVSIVLAKGVVRGAEGESREASSIQEKLRSLGGENGVTIEAAGKTYTGIKTIEKISGNKKADFRLSGGSADIFVQHKSPTHQQMAGIAKKPYSDFSEVQTFVKTVGDQVAETGKLLKPVAVAIESNELKQLATYGTTNGTFSPDAAQLYCVGELDLVPGEKEGTYKLVGKGETYEYPTIPEGSNEPMLGATYRKGRNQSGIPDVRMGIYPKSYLRVDSK